MQVCAQVRPSGAMRWVWEHVEFGCSTCLFAPATLDMALLNILTWQNHQYPGKNRQCESL